MVRWCAAGAAGLSLILVAACSSGRDPAPSTGFGVLSGQRVLVLPVQYVRAVPGGWVGGAANAREAARQADAEIAFALGEHGGRAVWVTPEEQVSGLRRRPSIDVDPYVLSADELRREGGALEHVRDPLYGELRTLAALFDSRYAVWPLEILHEPAEEKAGDRLVLRTVLLDTRAGTVIWYGIVRGGDQPPASSAALAALAQRFAVLASP